MALPPCGGAPGLELATASKRADTILAVGLGATRASTDEICAPTD
ncbi:hypothetical protein [Rhodococcus wratislaviensis]|nr:hypothetical protein [Rhodococcus wratislaviensis]